jgi:hypothetical protein
MKNRNHWDVPQGLVAIEKFPIKIDVSILNSHCHFGRLDVHGDMGENAEPPYVPAIFSHFVHFRRWFAEKLPIKIYSQ